MFDVNVEFFRYIITFSIQPSPFVKNVRVGLMAAQLPRFRI